jgi:hypothetical protein
MFTDKTEVHLAMDNIQAQLLSHDATVCRLCEGPFNNFLNAIEHKEGCNIETVLKALEELEKAKQLIYRLSVEAHERT